MNTDEKFSNETIRDLLHPDETGAFLVALIPTLILSIISLLLVVFSLGLVLIYVGIIAFFLWVGKRLAMSFYKGNHVKINDRNFRSIHELLIRRKAEFGVEEEIEIFIAQDGNFNAAIQSLFGTKIILLPSELLKKENMKETDFIVTRFVGAIAAKHYRLTLISVLISIFDNIAILNLLILPYTRVTHLSGDRIALYAIGGDLEVAVNAQKKLMAGTDLGPLVTTEGLIFQCEDIEGRLSAWIIKMLSPFPHMVYRIKSLVQFSARRDPDQVSKYFGAEAQAISRALSVTLPENSAGSR